MIFRLAIEGDNDAFSFGERNGEVARILRELATKLEHKGREDLGGTMFDINGNQVGTWGWQRKR